MGNRGKGTASVPMNFATKHYEKLRALKTAGENVSAFIDRAIEHYDETFMPHPRGLDPWEVKQRVFRKNLSAVKRFVIDQYESPEMRKRAWLYQLQEWIALEEGEEE
tara:strand:+ start:942 stop:1262 length:321 start_codon:yes stop_codon:yes gene_type:complete